MEWNTKNIQYFLSNSLYGIRVRVRGLGIRLHQTKKKLINPFPTPEEVDHQPTTSSECDQHSSVHRRSGESRFPDCLTFSVSSLLEEISSRACRVLHKYKSCRGARLVGSVHKTIRPKRRKPRQSRSRDSKRSSALWHDLGPFHKLQSRFGYAFGLCSDFRLKGSRSVVFGSSAWISNGSTYGEAWSLVVAMRFWWSSWQPCVKRYSIFS